jgi:thymidine kinase
MSGRLEIIVGNMFSGKSTELIRRINVTKSIDKKCLVINYIHDNRYDNNSVATHDNNKINCLKVNKLSDVNVENYDAIFIDEGQFFTDLLDAVTHWVDILDKYVVVSGLDGDAYRKPFGDIIKLIPICDQINKLTAYCNICKDGTLAPFTKKITNDHVIIDIGGSDKYLPVCRKCYFN